jgi:beta-N-acetylhexosaminidase
VFRRAVPARIRPIWVVLGACLTLAACAAPTSNPAAVADPPPTPETGSFAPSAPSAADPDDIGDVELSASHLPAQRTAQQAPEQAPELQAMARCVAVTLAGMTRNQRAGQVLMIGVPAGAPGRGRSRVTGYQVGGVFLHGRTRLSVAAVREQTEALQAAATAAHGVPLYVAADQEGGRVQTLSGKGFPRLPPARTQGGWTPAVLAARSTGSAAALRRAGVTLNLAPVADTVAAADRAVNPPIGAVAREYGSTPRNVSTDVGVVVTASQAAGVTTAVKHFPGLGRVRVNTDEAAGAVDAVATAQDANLRPFRAAVTAGTGAVMISSARYPKLDARRIAPFSYRIVTDLLRGELGFTGVAVSDDLGAAGAVATVPVGERAVRFIGSGGDLVLTVRAGQVAEMRRALLQRAAASPAFARRLDQAAARVLTGKAKAGLLTCP